MNLPTIASVHDALFITLHEHFIRQTAQTTARKHWLNDDAREDLISEIVVATLKLPTAKRDDAKYVHTTIVNAAIDYTRKLSVIDKREENVAVEVISDETLDRRILFRQLFQSLSSEQQKVISLLYGLNGSQTTANEKIAKLTGLTEGRVARLRISAMQKLKRIAGVQNTSRCLPA